jgi:hypothetical protein
MVLLAGLLGLCVTLAVAGTAGAAARPTTVVTARTTTTAGTCGDYYGSNVATPYHWTQVVLGHCYGGTHEVSEAINIHELSGFNRAAVTGCAAHLGLVDDTSGWHGEQVYNCTYGVTHYLRWSSNTGWWWGLTSRAFLSRQRMDQHSNRLLLLQWLSVPFIRIILHAVRSSGRRLSHLSI